MNSSKNPYKLSESENAPLDALGESRPMEEFGKSGPFEEIGESFETFPSPTK